MARWSYVKLCTPHRLGEIALGVAAAVACALMVANIVHFTDGASLAAPRLANDDSYRLWLCAEQMYRGEEVTINVPYKGYPATVALLWRMVGGPTLLVPLLLNYLLMMLTLPLTALMAERVLGRYCDNARQRALFGAAAMAMTAACCYWLGCGVVILKEPSLYLAMAMIGVAAARLVEPRGSHRLSLTADGILAAGGALLLGFNRASMLYLVLLAVLALTRRDNWREVVCGVAIVIASLAAGYATTNNGLRRDVLIVEGHPAAMQHFFENNERDSHTAYNAFMGDYMSRPVWEKLCRLPITSGVQYLIPLVWNMDSSRDYGASQMYSHVGFPWYAVGGLMLFFILLGGRLGRGGGIGRWCLAWAIPYLAIAYVYGGTVSRYWLPMLPMYATVASYVLLRLRQGHGLTAMKWWATGYVTLLTVVLAVAYQMS